MVRMLLTGGVALLLLPDTVHGADGARARWPAAPIAPSRRCAVPSTVTPTFAPDGSLWLVWAAAGRVSVARSRDLGPASHRQSPSTPTARLDYGPDERPKIAIDSDGPRRRRLCDLQGQRLQRAGLLFALRSTAALTFAAPRPITADPESQRFEAIALRSRWLAVRGLARQAQSRAARKAKGEAYTGAALAFAWSKDAAPPSPTRASPRTTPANVAGSASPLRDPDARWCCSATSSAGPCATTR